jgi:hypothetical protein
MNINLKKGLIYFLIILSIITFFGVKYYDMLNKLPNHINYIFKMEYSDEEPYELALSESNEEVYIDSDIKPLIKSNYTKKEIKKKPFNINDDTPFHCGFNDLCVEENQFCNLKNLDQNKIFKRFHYT